MKRHIAWVVALAMASGAVAVVAERATAADDAAQKDQKATTPSLPGGIKAKEIGDEASAIRKPLTTLTEAAVTKGGFDDLVERLVDEDRNRIGDFAKQKDETLDGRIDQVRKAWKDKYGDDFDLDEDKTLQQVVMIRGEIEDPQAVASSWPLPPTTGGADAVVAGAAQAADSDAAKSKPGLNSNVEKGRDVAVAAIPPSHGLPQLNVSLVREALGWKVDVPNTVSGKQIHDKLLDHLTYLGDHADKWPGDKNEAGALFAHHVLMATYGLDVPTGLKGQQ